MTQLALSQQSLQTFNPDLFSSLRRNINSLKQKQVSTRKSALQQLVRMITTQQLPGTIFEQIGQMCIKDVLKCLSDNSQMCRQIATNVVIEILPRSSKIASFLPYIFSILIDRTNCHDLQGTTNLPQKMRPPPGQKPKVLTKIVQACEQIRVLYCCLIRKIVCLLQHQPEQIRKYLDDLINVQRALIMDPAPQVQKMACQTLQLTCRLHKDLLLHYTQIMGRAVLLPLISKKSKIRIAGLKTLTAVFWCGLYKYNAFVFQNLIGFRDPNSVPIKDFYEPSHNINYLATFITDSNNKVRLEFMKNLKVWICDLNDKYDHHGKLVPYLLSGLFDKDQQVQQTAAEAIEEIGRQIQTQRQKDFRQSKQFAIDAKWTWDGKLSNLSVTPPLKHRPSLGSRFFIRGHVRKFWHALYRQVRDMNMQNRYRACNLAIYGVIYTENYLTQYLDNMIPHLLTAVIAHQKQEIECCSKIEKIFYYIGRYCEQSAYLHIMRSALQGKLVQNEEFIKASLIALKRMVQGSLQAIPQNDGLCHKKQQVIDLLAMVQESGALQQIYQYNCKQVQQFVLQLIKGLKGKAKQEQLDQIFQLHLITILKLWSIGYYEQNYFNCFKLEAYQKQAPRIQLTNSEQVTATSNTNLRINDQQNGQDQHRSETHSETVNQQIKQKEQRRDRLMYFMGQVYNLFRQKVTDSLQQYLGQTYQNPPSLMDSDFKLVIVLNNYLIKSKDQQNKILFSLTQEIISESMSYNRSVEILNFCFKYLCWLFDEKQYNQLDCRVKDQTQIDMSKAAYKELAMILERCMANLNKFKPQRKVPVYDQHVIQQNSQNQQNPNIKKISQETFLVLFKNASQAFRMFYLSKISLTNSVLGQIFQSYVSLSQKMRISEEGTLQSIKTLWAVFQRENIDEEFPKRIIFKNQKKQDVKSLLKVIDYVIQKIETLGQPQHRRVSMLFSILQNWLKCFPVFKSAATSLPLIYPAYIELFEKVIKYAIDEKDIQLKQKFTEFLRKSNKKMKPWFQLEYKMALQSQKFIKAQFLKDILNI